MGYSPGLKSLGLQLCLTNPWLAVTDIYWDPQAGSDTNDGQTDLTPLATFAEIVARYGGTESPILPYGQSVTVHKLSAQNPGVDPVFFTPHVSGGGKAVLVDTLVVKTAAFVGGAVTAKNQATGTVLAVAGFPAGTAAGDYIFNQTRNSYANADTGGATPKMSQPLPAATLTTPGNPTLAEDNTWATGDTFIVYTRNLLNLKLWRPVGADAGGNTGPSVGGGWVQWSQIADSSGAAGSIYDHASDSGVNVLSGCQILGRLAVNELCGRSGGAFVLGCDVTGQTSFFSGSPTCYGTILRGGWLSAAGAMLMDGGTTLHGNGTVNSALLLWGDVFADGTLTVQGGGACRISASTGGTAAIWGSVAVTVNAMSSLQRSTGASFAATLLTSGALKLGANATGSGYVGAGVFTDGIALTAANIDTGAAGGAGLSNPVNGARYCNST